MLRTRKVSRRTPKATTKPSSVRKVRGRTGEHREGAGEDDPGADVMTPPVTARARRMPCFGAVSDRLLAGAGDQEDVVVDAERDQEDEGEER